MYIGNRVGSVHSLWRRVIIRIRTNLLYMGVFEVFVYVTKEGKGEGPPTCCIGRWSWPGSSTSHCTTSRTTATPEGQK